MRKTIKKIHKWIGIIIAVYVVLVSISGFVHILAHNHGAPKQEPVYFANVVKAKMPPSEVIKNFILPDEITAINMRQVNDVLYYQVLSGNKVNYFNAETGTMADIDAIYAEQLAILRLKKKVKLSGHITKFDSEYGAYKNVVPVYRFDTVEGDWERVYVSTLEGRVTYYLNENSKLTTQIFRQLHMFSFIPQFPRDIFSGIMVIGLVVVTLFGVVLFFKPKKKK